MAKSNPKASGKQDGDRARLHLRFGWWFLLVSLTLGLILEGLHAWKAGWYLEQAFLTRRLMWTLAHAHGTLLGLVNIAFALTLNAPLAWKAGSRALASRCLLGATVLLPLGFLLGGVFVHGGDPGLGALLVPPAGLLLLLAVLLTARATNAFKG